MSPTPDLTGPRSVRAHAAVLTATMELLRAGGLSVRVAIAGEAMADATPLPDTGSARDDLVTQVQQVSAFLCKPRRPDLRPTARRDRR